MAFNRQTDENGKPIVMLGDDYSWVKGEVRDLSSLFLDMESVERIGDPSLWVHEGSDVSLRFLPCDVEDRIYHRGEGWEFFYMYTTVFLDIGVKFSFTEFECGVLNQLKCAPTQIHPNGWVFIRGSEILMEYLGTRPLLEAKGVRKGGVVTLNSVQGKTEVLSLNMLFKWDKEREYVERYLETTTGGLKNFFKSRAERGHSASNVVKTEEGGVVNKPAESRRIPSMKRRRAEAGGSGKEKVIDLTSSRCCGKEVSLEEVKLITERQRRLHGYCGEEDLTSVWSEHFPISVVAEEHFQSKTDLDLIGSVDDLTRAQFMQVCAARLLCLGRYEELKAQGEAERKKEESKEIQRSLEFERKLQVVNEQLALRDKEVEGLKSDVEQLKGKLQKLDKERTELEARVVELCVEKKEAETSKENHGYAMLEIRFERARK
ncbi:hypothetical protein PIB30_040529 [Stylosanthes scabra]|uniref:Uncharacterized protein n=1 Tax=Stylosanthes scabra TaxID=79078 RepID=A0ABU6SEU2_9FABA|nr:hypothetical protein [Stylosanthes scabra]